MLNCEYLDKITFAYANFASHLSGLFLLRITLLEYSLTGQHMDSWSSTGLQINRVLYQVMAIWSMFTNYYTMFLCVVSFSRHGCIEYVHKLKHNGLASMDILV